MDSDLSGLSHFDTVTKLLSITIIERTLSYDYYPTLR